MPRSVLEYRRFIISPGDVADERAAIVDVIHCWNASVGANHGIRVEPVRWETHTHPDISGPAQAKVNEQIVDDCDFGIAVFWSRVGTPTAGYDSGSVEEVERLATRGAKVMLYRSSRPIPPDILDTRQYDKLRDLSDQYRERGLLGQFGDINELREMVNKDLSLLLGKESATTPVHTASQVETVQRPDIRVRTRNMVASQPELLHTPNAPQVIESGDSYSFYILPADLGDVDIQKIVCAEAHDKVGRTFNSDAEETRQSLDGVMKRHASS